MTRSASYQLHIVTDKALTSTSPGDNFASSLGGEMQQFITYMKTAKMSDATITKRVEIVERLRAYLATMDVELFAATGDLLIAWQAAHAHLAPASLHIYTRHVTAFYRWANRAGHIPTDPSTALVLPILRKTVPHPTTFDDLRTIFACVTGRLRRAYVLASFAGLRCGEICRFHSGDISYDAQPTVLIHGKAGKERRIPLLPPVMDEIGYARGWIVTTRADRPCLPHQISGESTRFLQGLGMPTTLHSMRAAFATNAARLTHDPLLVRDLLGHESVKTTEIYMDSSLVGAHERLAGFTDLAASVLRPARHLASVTA